MSSAAFGARTGLLAVSLQSTRAKVSPLQTRKRSGSSMITFSGQILPTWSYQEWSISASFRGKSDPQKRAQAYLQSSSSAKSSRESWWPTSAKTRLKCYDLNLKVDHILDLKEAQSNRCAACNIKLLWVYQPKDTQQFSVDRLDNTMGHTRDNTRLTCLECNRKRGYAVLNA